LIFAEERREREEREEVAELRARADVLETSANRRSANIHSMREELDAAPPVPDAIDTAGLLTEMAKARDTNNYIRERQRRQEYEAEAELKTQKETALTEAMRLHKEERRTLIATAAMPVPGLTVEIGDDDKRKQRVLFGGVPFQQLSQGQQIKISAAIAMAGNPKIRVIWVRNGSLLDRTNRRILYEAVAGRGYQLLIEFTDDDPQTGIIIEEGFARRAEPKPKPEEKQQVLSLGV
jgi:hypothetical protein